MLERSVKRTRRNGGAGLVAVSLCACSLQGLDYLQADGDAGSSNGGSISAGGNGGESGTGMGTGGDSASEPFGNESLVNGSFENGSIGWSVDPPGALDQYAFVQWPVSGSTTVDGKNQFSTWSDQGPFEVTLHQTLINQAAGRYVFEGHFNHGPGHNALYLFARDCGATDVQVDIPETLRGQWLAVELEVEIAGGRCEVGLHVDANSENWLNADLFSFSPAEG